MGSITPYESAKGRRYRVRYRKPDRTEAEKRGFTTMREAKLYLSMVTVSKSKGEYIDPSSSRVPVRMFADSWLRSKQPPMSKPSYYKHSSGRGRTTSRRSGPTGRSRRSAARKFRIEFPTLRRRSRARWSFEHWESSPASSTSPLTIALSRAIQPGTCAASLAAGRASVRSTSRTTRSRRWRRARRIRRLS
jgi:hypothetical protein